MIGGINESEYPPDFAPKGISRCALTQTRRTAVSSSLRLKSCAKKASRASSSASALRSEDEKLAVILAVIMFRRAAFRLRTTVLVVLALLFAQMALASYVCPTAFSAEPAAMEMAPGESCEGMVQDEERPALCYQHCNGAPQVSDLVKLPVVSLPAIVHVVELPLRVFSAQTLGPAAQPQPPPAPVFFSTLRLRF